MGENTGQATAENICAVDGCDRPLRGPTYCAGHRDRVRRTGSPGSATFRTRRFWDGATCTIPDCDRPIIAHGICKPHYYRIRRNGDARSNVPLYERRIEGRRCSRPSCERSAAVRDLCHRHYYAKRRAEIVADPVLLEAARRASREAKAAEKQRRPEQMKARRREWEARNPERMKLHWADKQRRRQASVKLRFTIPQLRQRLEYWGFRCWICRDPYEAIDHVKPLSKGGWHALMNLRPICGTCNGSKGARWPFPTRTR